MFSGEYLYYTFSCRGIFKFINSGMRFVVNIFTEIKTTSKSTKKSQGFFTISVYLK